MIWTCRWTLREKRNGWSRGGWSTDVIVDSRASKKILNCPRINLTKLLPRSSFRMACSSNSSQGRTLELTSFITDLWILDARPAGEFLTGPRANIQISSNSLQVSWLTRVLVVNQVDIQRRETCSKFVYLAPVRRRLENKGFNMITWWWHIFGKPRVTVFRSMAIDWLKELGAYARNGFTCSQTSW